MADTSLQYFMDSGYSASGLTAVMVHFKEGEPECDSTLLSIPARVSTRVLERRFLLEIKTQSKLRFRRKWTNSKPSCGCWREHGNLANQSTSSLQTCPLGHPLGGASGVWSGQLIQSLYPQSQSLVCFARIKSNAFSIMIGLLGTLSTVLFVAFTDRSSRCSKIIWVFVTYNL